MFFIPSWRFKFQLPLALFIVQDTVINLFLLSENVFILFHSWRIFLLNQEFWVCTYFYFKTLNALFGFLVVLCVCVMRVQSLSLVWFFATSWTTAHQASLSITNSWSLLKPMSIESMMPSSRLILCHPLLLLPSIVSSIRVFSNESAPHIRWPKYWSFSFNISPSNEYPGLISFRMDWLDLLAVQGTLKSRL